MDALDEPTLVGWGMDWHNTAEAARYTHRHAVTVRRAAANDDLHGHQSAARGRWTFAEAALDAWLMGVPERGQRDACGCLRLRVPHLKARATA